MELQYASTLLETAVDKLSQLPGIGRKTALRLALHILRQDEQMGVSLGDAIIKLRQGIKYCRTCHNISETDLCPICANPSRDASTICVVDSVKDGLYHVLGGVISPMEGVGPEQLQIASLVERVKAGGINEVILALSATMEGETTNFYIYRQLAPFDVKITQLARGVAVGNEIEYIDEITLGRSLVNRTLFSDSFADK